MPTRPEIFISATSRDLGSCRQLVRDALLTLGCVPVVQDHFPPGAGEVRAMLRERIAGCQAVIHLAGECYGYEPRERDPAAPRRSYTQMEYDIARELKKPLYTFLCAPDFPYDAHESEPEDLRRLQQAHRDALSSGDSLYLPIRDPHELSERVRELQTRVDTLARDLQKTRSWLGRGIAAAVGALVLIAGLLYGVRHQGEQGQARAEARAAQLQEQIAILLQQQTKLTALVVQNINPNAAAKTDPTAAAREQTARQLGISTEELGKRLAAEEIDLHSLLAQVEAGSTAAESKMAEWKKLKRETLTKLGDTEKAVGHYAAEIAPYQQALALIDKQQEPLLWCDAAQNLEGGLFQMGRYSEAEPLAREVMEKRTVLQGQEHPRTLQSVNNLASVLSYKGDYEGAETLFRRTLEARERTLGQEHPDTLRSIGNLAIVLNAKGDYAGAETLFRRTLEARERTLGQEHPDTLSAVSNLATVLSYKGDYAGAETLFRRTLEAQERTLGKEHPETLRSVNNLALVLLQKGDYAGAEALDRRCLEARERTLGREHPETLRSVNNLAALLKTRGDLAEAEALFHRCLEAQERTLGREHPDTLLTVSNLAQVLDAEGNDAAAELLYARAKAGMEHGLPAENSHRLDLDYHYSLMREKQGRLAEALPLAEHAVIGAAKTMPADSPDRLQYEKNLADLRAKLASAIPSPPPATVTATQ